MQQHRHRHVVRQVRDQHLGLARQLGDAQGVGVDHGEAIGGHVVGGGGDGKALGEAVIDLDGDHRGPRLEDCEGERTEARSDLDDAVGCRDPGRVHDLADRVGVDDEVLPQLLGRGHVEVGGEPTDLGGTEEQNGHCSTVVRAPPEPLLRTSRE